MLLAVFVVYNSNGREIASYDSQATKLTAVALGRHRTLRLDRAVLRTPQLAERSAFALDRDGRYRSAQPVLPALLAGGVATVARRSRLIDLDAPLAGALVAKLTASLLVALAVLMAFLAVRRRLGEGGALLVALGFGLGTNLWAQASQTLWHTETAVAAFSGAVLCLAVPALRLTSVRLWTAALLLGLAGAARPQLAPAVGVLALSLVVRRGRASDLFALTPLLLVGGAVLAYNLRYFGHPLGVVPTLEALHPRIHGVTGSFGSPLAGAAGLLVSPSRGLLVFSPVVLVVLGAIPALKADRWTGDLRWWAAAAAVQFVTYASYSVWWGGHTYGPRYAVDLMPLLVPLAAAGLPSVLASRWRRWVAAAALAWSVALAATGAFAYPAERWNTNPADVDRHHERLWDWRDPQFVRCWKSGPDPSNYTLFTIDAVRRQPVQKN